MTVCEKRPILLEKAFNIRDLSGYKSEAGEITSGLFLRGDSFEKLSEGDRDALMAIGVKTVVDLRNQDEITRTPSVFDEHPEVLYVNIPILPPGTQEKMIQQSGMTFLMSDLYIVILDNSQSALKEVFTTLASSDGRVLFHCSAGKDRTGIISAILLRLAGIDNETVVADYCLTEVFLKEKLDSIKKAAKQKDYGIPGNLIDEMMSAKGATMEKLLKHLEDTYGGAETYLVTIGLSKAEIETLKFKMIGSDSRNE